MKSILRRKYSSAKLKAFSDHDAFLCRIKKTLYYSRLPMADHLGLPVMEFTAELFNEVKSGLTLERLDIEEAGRISKMAFLSPCTLVVALMYLERLKDCNPEYLHKVAPSELFIVSLIAASKFLNDDGETDDVLNVKWAKLARLPVKQVTRLEKDFLKAIDWAIFVDDQDFWERLRKFEMDLAYKEGCKRGWFSYTELTCLLDNVPLTALLRTLVNVSSISLVTYTAGLMTLLGSILFASQLPGTSLGPRRSIVVEQNRTEITNFNDSCISTNNFNNRDCDSKMQIKNIQLSSDYFLADLDNNSRSFEDSCSESFTSVRATKTISSSTEKTSSGGTWKWWLNSMLTWLSEEAAGEFYDTNRIYDEKSNVTSGTMWRNRGIKKCMKNERSQCNGPIIANWRLLNEEEDYRRETENLIMGWIINWRRVLPAIFGIPTDNWRYYATRISFGY